MPVLSTVVTTLYYLIVPVPVCFCNSVSGAQYLIPESLPVQSDDDHGRVGEEALVVE